MSDERVSVLIMAGGRSRRMGQDKLWMMLAGKPLVQRVVERVLPLAREVLFSANTPGPFDRLARRLPVPARVVPDAFRGAGPLAGLHAGLSAMSGELLLALGGDMPFVNLALVTYMVEVAGGFDAVVPALPGLGAGVQGPEPLHAVYRRSCLGAVTARLAQGEHRMICFHADVKLRVIAPDEIRGFDPDFRSFFNVNTPEEWEAARRWIAG